MDDDGAGDFSFASTSSNPLEASYGSSSPASFASTRATSVWSSANKSSAWDDDDERPLKRTKLEGEANLGDVFTARRRPVFGATWGWNARADTTGDDRFIPSRGGMDPCAKFELESPLGSARAARRRTVRPMGPQSKASNALFRSMMQQELFGAEALDLPNTRPLPLSNSSNNLPRGTRPPILSFQPYARIPPSPKEILPCPSFLSLPSQFLISETTIPRPWVVASPPYKVLDAPELSSVQKSVVSWSKKNQLGVALGCHVYLLPEADSVVSRPAIKVTDQPVLKELTSLSWDLSGDNLVLADIEGKIHLLDASTHTVTRTLSTHSRPVHHLTFSTPNIFASAGVSGSLHIHDLRTPSSTTPSLKLAGHRARVCSLEFSPSDPTTLASGGTDERLQIWDTRSVAKAVFKARKQGQLQGLAWNPHQRGVLLTSGGVTDICVWNTLRMGREPLVRVDTRTSIGRIVWSQESQDFAFTSLQPWGSTRSNSSWGIMNRSDRPEFPIQLWRYPSLMPTSILSGHSGPTTQLRLAPNATSIVTGASDETVRFWRVFREKDAKKGGSKRPSPTNLLSGAALEPGRIR